ncbi:hypothetical protein JY456_03800 [Stenotrophomonas maltophilia]|nr:hypothetical protein [Stenotrophomonas maltophilia]
MTTDKTPATLATAKHGGCVRLPTSERHRFEAWARGIGACVDADEHGDYVDAHLNSAKLGWDAALPARQLVGVTEQTYNSGGIELTACQLRKALLMAGTPELGMPFEDRSRVRIFQSETGHSGLGLYCECVDVEEEGFILLDGTSPAISSPVEAACLGTGVKAIAAERERQLQEEGFTRESDQQYRRGELARAATAYVQLAAMDLEFGTRDHIAWHGQGAVWPWAPEWWKPVDARCDLVSAGALIAAQIDLIDSQGVSNG